MSALHTYTVFVTSFSVPAEWERLGMPSQAMHCSAKVKEHDLVAAVKCIMVLVQVLSLEEALSESRKKLESTHHSASSNKYELAALHSTIEALRREQREQSEQLRHSQAQHAAAKQASELAHAELAAARQEVRRAQEQAGQHLEEVADVRMKLAQEKHGTAAAQAVAATATQELEAARAEVSGLQMEVEGLRGQLEEAEGRYVIMLQESRENASSSAASAAAAASGDLEGLQVLTFCTHSMSCYNGTLLLMPCLKNFCCIPATCRNEYETFHKSDGEYLWDNL
jgi:septal ring factor EnvC (AmiA/AmiB activator)